MMKNFIKTLAIAAIAVTLAGCAENNKSELDVNKIISSVIEENTTSEAEGTVTSSTSAESKPEEKPAESSSTTTVESKPEESSSVASKPVEKPVATTSSTTTTKPVEKPVESKPTISSTTTTTTTKPVEKPIEKPVHTHKFTTATCEKPATCECGKTNGNALGHNFTKATCKKLATCTTCGATKGTYANHHYKNGTCRDCGKKDPDYVELSPCEKYGHVSGEWIDEDHCICKRCGEVHTHDWDVTYTTTEPKWCREMHDVLDYGFDSTLAGRYLGISAGEATKILRDNLKAMDVPSATGSATLTVEVWGTETYWRKECKTCNQVVDSGNIHTINPMGEWRYINGVNPRCEDPRLNLNTLFYDPYNIPQVVIDNINLMWEIMWE